MLFNLVKVAIFLAVSEISQAATTSHHPNVVAKREPCLGACRSQGGGSAQGSNPGPGIRTPVEGPSGGRRGSGSSASPGIGARAALISHHPHDVVKREPCLGACQGAQGGGSARGSNPGPGIGKVPGPSPGGSRGNSASANPGIGARAVPISHHRHDVAKREPQSQGSRSSRGSNSGPVIGFGAGSGNGAGRGNGNGNGANASSGIGARAAPISQHPHVVTKREPCLGSCQGGPQRGGSAGSSFPSAGSPPGASPVTSGGPSGSSQRPGIGPRAAPNHKPHVEVNKREPCLGCRKGSRGGGNASGSRLGAGIGPGAGP